MLPPDPPVHVRPGVRLARGEQDQLHFALAVPRDRADRVGPVEPQSLHQRIELRDRAVEILDREAEVIEDGHAASLADPRHSRVITRARRSCKGPSWVCDRAPERSGSEESA